MIHKRVELKARSMNSLPPQWCRYLYCCLTHSSCVEVTQIWGLVHVEKVLSVYVVHIDILTMLDCFTELTILVLQGRT